MKQQQQQRQQCSVLVFTMLLLTGALLSSFDSRSYLMAQSSAPTTMADEQNRILQTLKSEVEPNLLKNDIDRLNRSVMRLGSYWLKWAKEAREFLTANATLSELYLYRYALARNPRLNNEIVKTLASFSTHRFPRAVLAFMEVLATTPETKANYMSLLAKAVTEEPSMAEDAINTLNGAWGADVPVESKLEVAVAACKVQAPATRASAKGRDVVMSWANARETPWQRVMAAELSSCFRTNPS